MCWSLVRGYKSVWVRVVVIEVEVEKVPSRGYNQQKYIIKQAIQ